MHSDPSRSRSPSPDPERLLRIYLNDHYAGSAGGVALVRRIARVHRDGPAGPRLRELAEEIAEDRESLVQIMTALDVPVMRARTLAVRLAEKVGRIKLNGRLVSRSTLSDVLELELLRLGVEGKLALWRSLRTIARADDRIPLSTVDHLADRAERQIELLEGMRLAAVDRTFLRARAH
ncbi:hypothetical protein [Streptomyces bambusae]|uniref:Uncharacterized protein n=1 Tax=Streptomyces bambusae TaxID=1550616 RepID=A0ABS6ZD30_9ACTN|nr:hypothetical protein [Streptomyces bambusae]MBW5484641.1 hypothetical protein [Streptomyces bambusae]